MRLNRFLASAGLGSRRSCEELIRTGQVTINGVMCENLATTVESSDVVKVGNHVLQSAAPVTLLLHKPPGFLCTASDTHNRRTIFDLLPTNYPRLFHVGRLDMESEGLLIVTNDGDLSLKLTHPRYKVEKEYEVVLDRSFDFEFASKLLRGISLEEGWAKVEAVHKLGSNKLKVVLRQGMKRQIRLMFYALGYEVKKLVRVRIGPIHIQSMPPGSWRVLRQKEIEALLAAGVHEETGERPPRRTQKPRPAFRAAPKRVRAQREERRPEEIPFVPRALRSTDSAERPQRAPGALKLTSKPGGKPFGKKPFGAKAHPATRKSAAKKGPPAPRPFAKFERRRFDP